MFTLIGDIPRHHYVYVDTTFTHKEPCGFVPAVWFGLVSYPGRTWGLNVMLDCGAIYRNLPPHAIAFDDAPPVWTAKDAQRWDCYGWDFTVLEYRYLSELKCKTFKGHDGVYLFTAAPVGDGFSAYPEQAKEFSFIQLDNGRLTIQPTNFVIFEEQSFTGSVEFPKGLKKQTESYSCED